ncbi:MAG: hypothetical protein WCI05_16145 [Myxococcales bacterium]
MTSDELIEQLRTPTVVRELKQVLGLPDIVQALREVEDSVNRMDRRIDKLTDAVYQLTQAQTRTDQAITVLGQRMTVLGQRMDQLVEAQARTDQTVERLGQRVDQLGQRVDQLVEAQARTERTVDRLGQTLEHFMAATERNFTEVRQDMTAIRKEVGALSLSVGLDVEEMLAADLPDWLERHHQLRATLEMTVFLRELGDEELDAFGQASGPQGNVWILAEAKNRIRAREVEAFWSKAERVRAIGKQPLFPVLIGRAIYPDAKEKAQELGLTVITSSALRR